MDSKMRRLVWRSWRCGCGGCGHVRCSGRDITAWRQRQRHVTQSNLHSVDQYYFHWEPTCPAQV